MTELAEALRLKYSDERLSKQQERLLRQHERAERKRLGAEWVKEVPKLDYQTWANKSRSVLDRHRAQWGWPGQGRTIDLPEVVAWIHEFIDQNAALLQRREAAEAPGEDDERLLRAKADMAELQRDEKMRQLLRRDDVHQMLLKWSAVMKTTGEKLGQKFGPDAQDLMTAALDTCQTLIDEGVDS